MYNCCPSMHDIKLPKYALGSIGMHGFVTTSDVENACTFEIMKLAT